MEVKDFAFYEKKFRLILKQLTVLFTMLLKYCLKLKKYRLRRKQGIAYKFLAEAAFDKGNDNEAIALVNKAFFCFKDLDAVQEDLADCNRILGAE